MSAPSSTAPKKSGGEFPAGLRVLVVDDDPTCLKILEKMLKNCLYEATTCNRPEKALRFLRDNKNGFDVVISDVHMPDMDGFKLLELVGLEMDLPVIMMSADDSKDVVMKGVTHGACDYLIKPVRIEALKNIWQHVVRKKKHERKDNDYEQSGRVEDGERQQNPQADVECSSSANEGNWKSSKRRKEDESEAEGEGEDKDDTCSMKKPRVVWSPDLHQQFVAAVSQLGIDKAVPKKILELMNVPGLSRENVASHLQKYRLYLRRLGSVSPYSGFDLQTLVTSAQIPSQSLASIGEMAIHKTTARIPVSAPHMGQGNLFMFGGPNLRSGESQQWLSSNSSPTNMLHGIPTNIEPRQLASMNKSGQSFGSMTMKINSQADQSGSLLVPPPLSRSALHENGGRKILGLPSSRVRTISSNGICGSGLRQSFPSDGTHGTIYAPVDLSPANNVGALPGNNFPHGTLGTSNPTSRRLIQDEINSEAKGSGGLGTSYECYNGLKQQKVQDWGLQYVESNFNAPQNPVMQGSIDPSRETLVQPGLPSFRENGQNGIRNASFSSGGGISNGSDYGLPPNSFTVDNSFTNKAESLPDASCFGNSFLQQPSQEDLLSILLKQQDNFGLVENDCGFDGYSLSNLPA